MRKYAVSIIGAGIGGLAAAIRLAASGRSVTVYEKNALPGGKAGVIRKDGFRFDTGPSLFTLPGLVADLLSLGDEAHQVPLYYEKLKTVCTYFYEDGTRIQAWSDPAKFALELAAVLDESEVNVLGYLNDARNIYDASADVFIFSPIEKLLKKAINLPLVQLSHLLSVNPLRSMHAENTKRFKSPKVVQLFDRYATYNGSSPYLAPATLSVIAHLEHNLGAYFPDGGIYAIVEALYKKAKLLGVEFYFNTEAKGLSISGTRVNGVITEKGIQPAEKVVSDVDVNWFYRHIMSDKRLPRMLKKPRLSSSALIFYWGMNRSFGELNVHNILFSGNYQEEFRHLFKLKEVYSDPTVYIYISSKLNAADAPAGCENWFVMINVPAIEGHNWSLLKSLAKKIVVDKIKMVLKVDPLAHIVSEQVATPQTIEDTTASYKGALYGNSSNSLFSAFRRHPNRSGRYKNLYFTGGSVHPGGGIPLCLASAKLVEEAISGS